MKFIIQREQLLKPLQLVSGVVEKRQTIPILSNVLLEIEESTLTLTGSDLEVELIGRCVLETPAQSSGSITVPSRKLFDICRSLPNEATIELHLDKDRMIVSSGKSRFTLATLPAEDYPKLNISGDATSFKLSQGDFKHLLQRTHFAMGLQDVRLYLNGMLLEVTPQSIRTVATDGHRLAMATLHEAEVGDSSITALIPRKGVLELLRLLEENDAQIQVSVTSNHIRAQTDHYTFTSKLIDCNFPNYERVIPKQGDKNINLEKDVFKSCLQRTAILSNEKFRGVKVQLDTHLIRIEANNPEQEEAHEELPIHYEHDKLEMGFNVDYLIDVLNSLSEDNVKLTFSDGEQGVLIEEANCLYVVMPMRL